MSSTLKIHLTIQTEWHQLKTHELSGRMFEDEYDERNGCYRWQRKKEPKE